MLEILKFSDSREFKIECLTQALMLKTELHAPFFGLEPQDMVILSQVLSSSETLIYLHLGYNDIEDFGADELASMLQANKVIKYLNLEGNKIGYKGALALSLMLKEATSALISLSIGFNQIGYEGAISILATLETNTKLTSLDLASSHLDFRAASLLKKVLKTNQSLMNLELTDNPIGFRGAQALAKGLAKNETLSSLYLANTALGLPGIQALADILKTNQTLTVLDLRFNNIGKSGEDFLIHALEENLTLLRLDLDFISQENEIKRDCYLKRNQTLLYQKSEALSQTIAPYLPSRIDTLIKSYAALPNTQPITTLPSHKRLTEQTVALYYPGTDSSNSEEEIFNQETPEEPEGKNTPRLSLGRN